MIVAFLRKQLMSRIRQRFSIGFRTANGFVRMKNSKTDDNKSTQSTDKQQDDDFVTRRRVVKGLAGLPVILTLGNGSAQANASAHQCLTKITPVTEPQPSCTPTGQGGGDPYPGWVTQIVTHPDTGQEYVCVVYAEETDPPGSGYDILPYTFDVDQNGTPVPPSTPTAHPMSVSCDASFV
jgi:hypothetical protein